MVISLHLMKSVSTILLILCNLDCFFSVHQGNVCSQIPNQIHYWREDAGNAEDSREKVRHRIYEIVLLTFLNLKPINSVDWKSFFSSHTSTAMKHSEAAVLTVADLADLFTEDTEPLEWIWTPWYTGRDICWSHTGTLYTVVIEDFAHSIFYIKILKWSNAFPKRHFSRSLITDYNIFLNCF